MPKGCPACNYTGYSKRTAIHEVLAVTREVRDLIERRATADQIRRIAMRLGMTTLRENCTKLVLDGVTTVEELIKVTRDRNNARRMENQRLTQASLLNK
jgi:type IV pilus assembly protein PilB